MNPQDPAPLDRSGHIALAVIVAPLATLALIALAAGFYSLFTCT